MNNTIGLVKEYKLKDGQPAFPYFPLAAYFMDTKRANIYTC